jgi:hypothetical protein
MSERKPGRPLKSDPNAVALLLKDIYDRRAQKSIDVLQDIYIAEMLAVYGCPIAIGWAATNKHPPCRHPQGFLHIFNDFRDVTYLGAHSG